eukprot:TRINITY_DN1780_c0_g1_i1.p1 TRINITY_DN1780_c0_g1~~TRINITY_DN1780_c0_g1_i1.p1  ORF type:complete len:124 (+),score=10.54 TRINITY_DN1780_c0_g1_i1:78-449(+)
MRTIDEGAKIGSTSNMSASVTSAIACPKGISETEAQLQRLRLHSNERQSATGVAPSIAKRRSRGKQFSSVPGKMCSDIDAEFDAWLSEAANIVVTDEHGVAFQEVPLPVQPRFALRTESPYHL